MESSITIRVNGEAHSLAIDTRTSLLDLLRERLGLTGAKKGCDQGQCGACTVLLDAFQCGYCTPGQLCSAAGMLEEFEAGWPSVVGGDELTDTEIRERMSGNLCRCGAYMNIVGAIAEVRR